MLGIDSCSPLPADGVHTSFEVWARRKPHINPPRGVPAFEAQKAFGSCHSRCHICLAEAISSISTIPHLYGIGTGTAVSSTLAARASFTLCTPKIRLRHILTFTVDQPLRSTRKGSPPFPGAVVTTLRFPSSLMTTLGCAQTVAFFTCYSCIAARALKQLMRPQSWSSF